MGFLLTVFIHCVSTICFSKYYITKGVEIQND